MGKRSSLAILAVEADSSSTNTAQLRAAGGFPKGPKLTKKPLSSKNRKVKKVYQLIPKPPKTTESAGPMRVKTHLRESDGIDGSSDGKRFRVILIQEGMGNLRDCFYYTKDCLKASAPLFEGKKCFADHPNQLEEQIHPERSTKDVLGYYENCEYAEDDGRGQIQADLVL